MSVAVLWSEVTLVSTSYLWCDSEVVGLYNSCTLEAYRRRSFGLVLTLQPLSQFSTGSEGFTSKVRLNRCKVWLLYIKLNDESER